MELIVKGLIVLFNICKKKEHEIKGKTYFGVILLVKYIPWEFDL